MKNDISCKTISVPAEDDTTVIRNSNGEEVNDNDVFHPDDKLICNDITANPSPDITWTWDNGTVSGTVYDNPFTFKETMIGYEYNISCEASNEVNGLTHTGRATLSSISVDEGNFSFMRLTFIYVTRSGKMSHFDKRALEAKMTLHKFLFSYDY